MGAGNELPGGSSIPTTPNKSAVSGNPSPSYLKGFLAMALAYAAGGWGAAALVGAKFFGGAAMGPVMESFKTWMGEHVGVNTSQHFSGYVPGAASQGLDLSQFRWNGGDTGADNLSDMDFEGGEVGASNQQPGFKLPPGQSPFRAGTVGTPGQSYLGGVGWGGGYFTPKGDFQAPGKMFPNQVSVATPNDQRPGGNRQGSDWGHSRRQGAGQLGDQGMIQDRLDQGDNLGALFNAPWSDGSTPTGGPPVFQSQGPSPDGGGIPQGPEEEEEEEHWEGPGGLPTYTPMTFNPTFLAWQPGNTGNPQFTSGASSSSLTPEQIAALLAGGK